MTHYYLSGFTKKRNSSLERCSGIEREKTEETDKTAKEKKRKTEKLNTKRLQTQEDVRRQITKVETLNNWRR